MKTIRYLITILVSSIILTFGGNKVYASEINIHKHFTLGSLMGFPTTGLTVRTTSGHNGINFSINYTTPFLPRVISIPKASLHYVYYLKKDYRHSWYIGIGPSVSFLHIDLSGIEMYKDQYEPMIKYDPEVLDLVHPEHRLDASIAINKDRKKRKPGKSPFYSQHKFYFHPVDIIIGKEFFKKNGTSNFIEMQLTLFKYEDESNKWTRVWASVTLGKGF